MRKYVIFAAIFLFIVAGLEQPTTSKTNSPNPRRISITDDPIDYDHPWGGEQYNKRRNISIEGAQFDGGTGFSIIDFVFRKVIRPIIIENTDNSNRKDIVDQNTSNGQTSDNMITIE
jgi:hypothetical protein